MLSGVTGISFLHILGGGASSWLFLRMADTGEDWNLPAVVCVSTVACRYLWGNLADHALRSLFLMFALASAALGQSPGNRTYFGEDIYVASGQQVHNATCFFCSVQVEGDLTGHVFVLFGSLNVSGQVRRDATVIVGNAVVDSQARIGGDTVVLGGNAVYETDESLSGSAYVLGGHLSHVSKTNAQN